MADLVGVNPYTTPTLKPPPGQQSNFVDPPSSENWLVAVGALCLTVAVFFISARTFVKTYIIKKTQIEDYALIFAGLGFAAFVGVAVAAGNAGQGRHGWDVSVAEAKPITVLGAIIEILYGPAMFPAKFCVLMQMLRIFRGTKKDSVYWAILILTWSNFVFYVAVTFYFIFACGPRAQLSNPFLGICMKKSYSSVLATSAINIASDFSILLLPVFAVWKLKIACKRKITISAVFGVGLFACISSIIRLVYSVRLTLAEDSTWAVNAVVMWAFAEFTTVILAGAFPVMPRLIQWLHGHKDSPAYVQPYQKASKPSYVTTSNCFTDAEAGNPGRGFSLVTAIPNSYIPLEEGVGYAGPGPKAEGQQDLFGTGPSVLSKNGWEVKGEMGKVVFKTMRVDPSYSP